MEATKNLIQGICDVTFSGRFTFSDHSKFRAILAQFSEKNVNQVIFHMAGLEFVDSAALGMLLLALDESEKHNKLLVITGATGQVKKMFEVARFDSLFMMN